MPCFYLGKQHQTCIRENRKATLRLQINVASKPIYWTNLSICMYIGNCSYSICYKKIYNSSSPTYLFKKSTICCSTCIHQKKFSHLGLQAQQELFHPSFISTKCMHFLRNILQLTSCPIGNSFKSNLNVLTQIKQWMPLSYFSWRMSKHSSFQASCFVGA